MRTFDALYIHGYRFHDVWHILERKLPAKPDLKVREKLPDERTERIARSMGMHVDGVAPCCCAHSDSAFNVAAIRKRFGRELPKVDGALMKRFRGFVRAAVADRYDPLPEGTDISSLVAVSRWLEHSHYPESRRAELRRTVPTLDEHSTKNKSHIKDEFYEDWKYPRWINSRHDDFKIFSGPFFKYVEEVVFDDDRFIKHIPVASRAQHIKDIVGVLGATYAATDFTSFEGSFTKTLIESCEAQLYKHMARNLDPADQERVRHICKALASRQRCSGASMSCSVEARMSGDMCTSLGNGFTNMMLMDFMAHEHGWKEHVHGVFEGDDGLFRVEGPLPDKEWFGKLGFFLKLEVSANLGEAGFCQTYFLDDEPEVMIDPLKTLGKFGWTLSTAKHGGPKVMKELLRAKAYSLLCSAPCCPVLGVLALRVLELTRGSKSRFSNDWFEWCSRQTWNIQACMARARRGPSLAQRMMVADKWGMSLAVQFEVEDWITSHGIEAINVTSLKQAFEARFPAWIENFSLHAYTQHCGSEWA